MTRIDLHPEDLLDRAARGVATPADLTRLEQHLAGCAVCRVERSLLMQAALDAAPRRDEKQVVARLTRDVGARLASPMARSARRKSVLVATALVAVCLVGAAGAATLAVGQRVRSEEGPPPRPPSVAPPMARAARATVPAPPEPIPPEAPPSEPPSNQRGREPARPPVAAIEPSSASELFSRANQARREGRVTEAVRLYRALQERHAGSSEELVSRVSLGRLLLDRLGDSRGALVQFNSYLASPGGGALREEAMVGRALSLGRLGRVDEERAAWQALLGAWPKSTHRARAQARLAELGVTHTAGPDAHRAITGKSTGGRPQ